MHPHAVLWVNGAPRWLSSQGAGESFAYAVTESGYVLGSTASLAGEDHWIYSAKTNSYRILEQPANLRISLLAGMNENQDIIGTAWDEASGEQVPSCGRRVGSRSCSRSRTGRCSARWTTSPTTA